MTDTRRFSVWTTFRSGENLCCVGRYSTAADVERWLPGLMAQGGTLFEIRQQLDDGEYRTVRTIDRKSLA